MYGSILHWLSKRVILPRPRDSGECFPFRAMTMDDVDLPSLASGLESQREICARANFSPYMVWIFVATSIPASLPSLMTVGML